MKKIGFILLFSVPSLIYSQTIVSYQVGLDKCRKIIEDNRRVNPDTFIYTGPECVIGVQIPEFSAITIDGETITSAYFKGRITILNFWHLSCPPCLAETPGFNKVIDKFGYEKLNYLAISQDPEKDIKHFLKNNPWGFSQIASGMEVISDVFELRWWGFPTTFVINEDAVIIAAFSGGPSDERAPKELEDTLTSLINVALK